MMRDKTANMQAHDGVSPGKRHQRRDAARDEARDARRDGSRDAERDVARDAALEQATVPLIVAMAEECAETIRAWEGPALALPASLAPQHLGWMCRKITDQAGSWPPVRLHRWIGFVQGGMIANRMLRLADAKRMFDRVKQAYPCVDEDLLDHLNPDVSFRLDLGGEA